MVSRSHRLCIAATFGLAALAASAAPVHDTQAAAMAVRLFPVLTRESSILAAANDRALAVVLAGRKLRISVCNNAADCVLHAALWTAAERERLDRAVARSVPDIAPASDDGIRAQVDREIDGINGILDVYGLHVPPRYPEIDGPVSTVDGKLPDRNLEVAVAISSAEPGDTVSPIDPSVSLALALLDANDRNQAVRYELFDLTLNGPARARARVLDWSKYRYTALIVPGIGPDDLDTPLSAAGKLNVQLAAARFADGEAPFIIVSGGAVHPRGTRFAEAIEMRRALIERFGIRPECIVVEPYARHTTTNLRNATRHLIALHAPLERDALIVTNPRQSAYIEGSDFAGRNQRELGYQPGQVGRRLSKTELLFRPASVSARVDPRDPLDP